MCFSSKLLRTNKEHKRNLPARWHKDRALFKATDVQTVELIPVHSHSPGVYFP